MPVAPLRAVLEKLGAAEIRNRGHPQTARRRRRRTIGAAARLEATSQRSAGTGGDPGPSSGTHRCRRSRRRACGAQSGARGGARLARGNEPQRGGIPRRRSAHRSLATCLSQRRAKICRGRALVAPFDRDAEWQYVLRQASELQAHGNEFGDNQALVEAIGVYRRALTLVSRERVPLEWATTQNESWQCARDARRARERHRTARRGRRRLSRRPEGTHPRARAARLGHDPEQSRQCALDARRARERHRAPRRGRRRLSRRPEGKDPRARAARIGP